MLFVPFVGKSAAQSGRTKPSPTPTPTSVTGPIGLSTPKPSPLPVATPRPRVVTTPTPNEDVEKVQSALVPIPVSVLDSNGRSVVGLKDTDFELKIDGKVVEIGEVFRSESPIRLAMLFDNSTSVANAREFEVEAAIRFFKRVIRPSTDTAALFSMADYTRLEQPLTRDVDMLTRAIMAFPTPAGATALFDGIIEVTDYLRSSTGRRVVVIVSDGEDTYSDPKTTLNEVIRQLQIHNCLVYVVRTKDFEYYKLTGSRLGNANIRALEAERRMQEITQQTGGAVYSPIDEREMNAAFDQISAALNQQYVLAYYPDDDKVSAGISREIAVTVKGKSGLTVRSRKGFVAR
ncbi:MAG TPA: VWA domain-containing protein [Pyrinomonadaceae bacterium]|nr:VWA domain-containing protein [Pyrinomonadaceae bacterium]